MTIPSVAWLDAVVVRGAVATAALAHVAQNVDRGALPNCLYATACDIRGMFCSWGIDSAEPERWILIGHQHEGIARDHDGFGGGDSPFAGKHQEFSVTLRQVVASEPVAAT